MSSPAVRAEVIPAELKERACWVLWRYESRDGKPTKVLYQPVATRTIKAKVNVPGTWGSFGMASTISRSDKWAGVGFVLTEDDPFVAWDLDGAIDENGDLRAWAHQIVGELDSYTEITPSGRGLRVIVRADAPRDIMSAPIGDGQKVEVFKARKYITVTGHRWEGTPSTIEDRTTESAELVARFLPEKPAAGPASGNGFHSGPLPPLLTDDEDLLRKARAAKNGAKFRELFDSEGNAGYSSASEADFALCGLLAFWTGGDRERIRRIFGRSARGRRSKWAERPNYQDGTLDKVLAGKTEFYRPGINGHANGHAEEQGTADAPPADTADYSELSDEALGIVAAEDVAVRAVRWLWPYRLAFGSMAMLAADGGTGKTLIALYAAARVTTGGSWPDGSGEAPRGTVVILSAEDKAEDTLKPRLMALGADLSRVRFLKARVTIDRPGKPPLVHPMSFQDLPYWQEVLRRIPDCKMLLVDPLPAYLGRGVNDHRNNEVRAVLEPFLSTVIEPRDCVLLAISHIGKAVDTRTPQNRILGSVAYSNIPRNVHVAFKDQEIAGRRIFAQVKCNNAPDNLPALAFTIQKTTLQVGDIDLETATPVFEDALVQIDVQQAMIGASKPGPRPVKTQSSACWLFDYLKDRPQPEPLAALIDSAGEAGLLGKRKDDGKWSSITPLYRAKDALPDLPAPRNGHVIEESEVAAPQGRPRKYWALATPVPAPDEGIPF